MKHLYPKTFIRSPFDDWNKPVSLAAIFVRSLIFSVCLLFVGDLKAQYSPGNRGKFGIDGDVYSDARQQGSFAPAGSHPLKAASARSNFVCALVTIREGVVV